MKTEQKYYSPYLTTKKGDMKTLVKKTDIAEWVVELGLDFHWVSEEHCVFIILSSGVILRLYEVLQ